MANFITAVTQMTFFLSHPDLDVYLAVRTCTLSLFCTT